MFLGEINWNCLKISHYQVLLLDFDGVIVETDDIHKIIICGLLKHAGEEVSSHYYENELLGKETKEIFSICLPDASIKYINELVKIKRKQYCEYVKNVDRNMRKHIQELIVEFRSNAKPVYIVSSSSVEEIEIWLNKWNVEKLFDKIITADMVLKGKPYQDIYNYALKICEKQPVDVVAIEDSKNGCEAAVSAGIDVFQYSTTKEIRNPRAA